MLNLQKLIIFFVLFGFMSSCDSWVGINMTNSSHIAKFQENIKKIVSSDMNVTEINFLRANIGLTNVMGCVNIFYVDSNDVGRRKYMSVDLSTWEILKVKDVTPSRGITNSYNADGILLDEFDFSSIPDILSKVKTMVENEGFEYKGISSFSIKFNNNPDLISYKFSVFGKSPNRDCYMKVVGKRTSRKYCYCSEIEFYSDYKANITIGKIGKMRWRW